MKKYRSGSCQASVDHTLAGALSEPSPPIPPFQVGIAIGFYVPTAIVTNATNIAQIGHDLQVLFFGTAAFTSLVFILIFFGKPRLSTVLKIKALRVLKHAFSVFSDAPPVPPSRAQQAAIAASIEHNYLHSLWRLIKNRNYLLLVTTYGKIGFDSERISIEAPGFQV